MCGTCPCLCCPGILMLLSRKLPIAAAVLTIVGYSLNDTVVAFDRIRENFIKLRGISAEESMNISINENPRSPRPSAVGGCSLVGPQRLERDIRRASLR